MMRYCQAPERGTRAPLCKTLLMLFTFAQHSMSAGSGKMPAVHCRYALPGRFEWQHTYNEMALPHVFSCMAPWKHIERHVYLALHSVHPSSCCAVADGGRERTRRIPMSSASFFTSSIALASEKTSAGAFSPKGCGVQKVALLIAKP